MAKLPALITVQEHTEKAARDITAQILKLAQRFQEQLGKGHGDKLVMEVLKSFVGASAYTVLMNEAAAGDQTEEDAQRAIQSFAAFKSDLQDSVASGFADAMFQFSGRNTDFYCQITPVPEPINTQPC